MSEDQDPPIPMIALDDEFSSEPSKINRVTLRYLSIRERGNEPYQDFPQNEYVGCEIAIEHKQAAYVVPDMEVDSHTKQLNFGWIDSPRMVVILNRTIWKGTVKPSKSQRQAIEECVLLVGFTPQSFPIRLGPKQQQPLLLSSNTKIYVRAESGTPIISVFAV